MPIPDRHSPVQALFPTGAVPQRAWVLSQAIRVDIAELRSKMPDGKMWPAELDELRSEDGRHKLVTRQDVFAIAERAADADTPCAAAQLHVACVAWGTSPGLTLSRALRPLSEPGVEERLAAALRVVRTEGALSAFRALNPGGRLKVRNLAAGFFTKFLYFGGYDSKPLMGRPLIYDSKVAAALRKLTGDRDWTPAPTADTYGRYLDTGADWARELDTAPDVIERALFGRRLPSQHRCRRRAVHQVISSGRTRPSATVLGLTLKMAAM